MIIIFQEDSQFKTGCSLPCPELSVQLFPREEGKASNFSKQPNYFFFFSTRHIPTPIWVKGTVSQSKQFRKRKTSNCRCK